MLPTSDPDTRSLVAESGQDDLIEAMLGRDHRVVVHSYTPMASELSIN